MFKQTIVALGAMLALAACGQPAAPSAEPPAQTEPEREVVVFEFYQASHDQRFRAQTDDPAVIARARTELTKPMAERTLHINGALTRGDGVNAPWSWSFGAWDLAEISMEVCDGWPSDVEENLDRWMELGSFCPWSSRIDHEVTS